MFRQSTAVIYGAQAGSGGLGTHAATTLIGLANGVDLVHAIGYGSNGVWVSDPPNNLVWHQSPTHVPVWKSRYTWLRWLHGTLVLQHDSQFGHWAAREVKKLWPCNCYTFTQVGLETLHFAAKEGLNTVLDNPNGHIRHYRDASRNEFFKRGGKRFFAHPCSAMVERVEEEYDLAPRIRVSSTWAKRSMIEMGVSSDKIFVVPQPVNLSWFTPSKNCKDLSGPLRVCYVGRLDLAKGFLYLLQAINSIGPKFISLQIVGATGSRYARKHLARHLCTLNMQCSPGDPLPAYQRAEIFVLPSLHDGFGLVVAEAMACGLPVIVTDACGAEDWVINGENGWIIPAGNTEALTEALLKALSLRNQLPEMGRLARLRAEQLGGANCLQLLNNFFYSSTV